MYFLQLLNEHWNFLAVLAALVAGWALWHLSQRFVSKKEYEAAIANLNLLCEQQGKTLAELSGCIVKLSAAIDNMPNTAALHRLELGLEEVRGLQRETAAQLKGQSAAMERLNNNFDRIAMSGGKL